PLNESQVYYDSRHNIPFAWFFFFHSLNLRMVDVHFRDTAWREVRLFASKEAALSLFLQRKQMLLQAVHHAIEPALIDDFANLVAQRPGKNLVMDPHEGTDGWSDEENFSNFSRILRSIETGASVESVVDATEPYCGELDDPESIELNIIGATYWAR
ncbi:MAG: hypothetical protein ACK4UN_19485, partial [Limisphaerales bacterium]